MNRQDLKERDLAILEALRHASSKKAVAQLFNVKPAVVSSIIRKYKELAASKGVHLQPRRSNRKHEAASFDASEGQAAGDAVSLTSPVEVLLGNVTLLGREEEAKEEATTFYDDNQGDESPYVIEGPSVPVDDMYLAATLVVLGHTINSLSDKPNSIDYKIINFDNDTTIRVHMQRYWNGTLAIEPKAYKLALIEVRNKVRGDKVTSRGGFYGHTYRSTY